MKKRKVKRVKVRGLRSGSGQQEVTLSQEKALARVSVDKSAGTLRNVAVITRGPAAGHGFEIDDVMLRQVRDAINQAEPKVKSRLTHPGPFSEDPIMRLVGHVEDARIENGSVRASVKIGRFAEASPSGDLRKFILAVAEEAPESIGLSIAFEMAEPEIDEENENAPPRARLRRLKAVDFVGDPAANPKGLLSEPAGNPSPPTKGSDVVNKQMKEYLQSLGLAAEATDEQALEFLKTLGKTREQAEKEAREREVARAKEIRGLAKRLNLDEKWADEQVDGGFSVEVAKQHALEALEKRVSGARSGAPDVRVGEDRNLATLGPAIEDAIIARLGRKPIEVDGHGEPVVERVERDEDGLRVARCKTRAPHERSREFRGMTLIETAREYLRALGCDVSGMSRQEIARAMFNPTKMAQLSGSYTHSTGDFPLILENIATKTLRQSYAEAPSVWPLFARRTTAPDFKQVSRVQLGEAPSLPEVPESGEVTYVTIGENREKYQLATFAAAFAVTWQTLVNDDLDAFSRLTALFGAAARRREDVVALAPFTGNPNMSDGVALFNSAHANIISGTASGAPSVAQLNLMTAVMMKQTGVGGEAVLDISPTFILGPAALRGTILELLQSTNVPGGTNETKNIWQNQLTPIITAKLDASSAKKYWLLAAPNLIDTVEVCFLEDEPMPTVDQEDGFNVLGRRFRVRHSVAAKAIDHRGMVQNDGGL